jgi:hypothetical protein
MTFWRSSAGKVLISWIKISTFDIIVFDKEYFTTTNYGFSFKLLIFIYFRFIFHRVPILFLPACGVYFYRISTVFLLYSYFSPLAGTISIVFPLYFYRISLSPRQLSSLNDSKIKILFNI